MIPAMNLIKGFFWAALLGAVALALLFLILPATAFLAFNNYLQIAIALAGSLAFLFFWSRYGNQEFFLWAGAGFGLWGISNIAWYLSALSAQRSAVFPGPIDAGMIVSILLLAGAYRKGLVSEPIALPRTLAILAACLATPVAVILVSGPGAAALVMLLYFLACAVLILSGLDYSLKECPTLLVGTLLVAVTLMIYPIREMFLGTSTILPVIGTFLCVGFSLIVLAMAPVAGTGQDA